jgi:glutathione S-transferase
MVARSATEQEPGIEPPILELGNARLLEGDKPCRLRPSGILDEYPNLAAYVARGEARPAYKRAFDAQLAVNTAAR